MLLFLPQQQAGWIHLAISCIDRQVFRRRRRWLQRASRGAGGAVGLALFPRCVTILALAAVAAFTVITAKVPGAKL